MLELTLIEIRKEVFLKMNKSIMSFEKIQKMNEDFKGRNLRVLQNATLKNGINNATLNNDAIIETKHVFSENIETKER